jgi:FkbM family methyltransferase
MSTFYSQQGEDVYIYYNFINKVAYDGIFVELGAMNGIVYSNTKFFEDRLKFTGSLIEPTKQYDELYKLRPKCKCYNYAVNYTKEKVKFLGDSATAGLVSTMSDKFKANWHKNSYEYYVDGKPMHEIMKQSSIDYIDLLTIDVEGGEQVVLETFDFKIPVYVICIELDGHNIEKDEKCRNFLLQIGFTFKKRFCINEFWVNENYFRKDLVYDKSITPKLFNSSIYELGNFPYLARHVVNEVQDALKSSYSQS